MAPAGPAPHAPPAVADHARMHDTAQGQQYRDLEDVEDTGLGAVEMQAADYLPPKGVPSFSGGASAGGGSGQGPISDGGGNGGRQAPIISLMVRAGSSQEHDALAQAPPAAAAEDTGSGAAEDGGPKQPLI